MSAPSPFGNLPQGDAPKATFGSAGPVTLPADPNYEPMERPDVLEKDGFFDLVCVKEKPVEDGVWLTLEVQDEDFRGKRIQMKLDDFTADDKSAWKWRNLAIACMNSKEAGKQPIQYTQGMFANARFCGKTQAYTTKNGDMATGLESTPVMREEYNAAVRAGKHRWPAVVRAPRAANGFAAPTGLPQGGGFAAPPATPQPPATAPVGSAPVGAFGQPAANTAPPTAPAAPMAPPPPPTAAQPNGAVPQPSPFAAFTLPQR